MFKLIFRSYCSPLTNILKRVRLYHPSLQYLTDLSKENARPVEVRSQEFSILMESILINGTWKRTGVGRLVDLDEWAIKFFPPRLEKINMLEIGGSDGSTTYDSVQYFRQNMGIEIKASIMEMNLRLHCYCKWCIRYYLTYDWNPFLLQMGAAGALLEETKNKEGVLFNPIIRCFKKLLKRTNFYKYLSECEDVLFENPAVRNGKDIVWLEQSLFEYNPSIVDSFNYIRCCNVLNNDYFDSDKIRDAINLLIQYLKPDGILLISRTVDIPSGVMHTASLWRKSDNQLIHVSDLNGGSEVKNLTPV